MDRLQRAVAGWVGPVVYALPIVEVWLLMRLDEDGSSAFLVVLQVLWVGALGVVTVACARRWHPPQEDVTSEPAAAAARPPSRAVSRSGPPPRRRGDH